MKRLGWFFFLLACPAAPTQGPLPATIALPESAGELVVGDINADGHLDLAASSGKARFFSLHEVTEPYHNVFSALLTPITLRSSMSMVELSGKTTLVVTGIDEPNARKVLLLLDSVNGAAKVSFLEGEITESPYHALGDFDGDGDLDLSIVQTDKILLYANEGGVFSTTPNVVPMAIPLLSRSLAVGDVDGDGFDDLVGTGTGGTAILFGEITAAGIFFSSPSLVSSEPAAKIRLSDLSNDGRPEVVTISSRSPVLQFFSVSPTRTTTLIAEELLDAPRDGLVLEGYRDAVLSDLNADGNLDIAAIRLLSDAQGLTTDLAVLFSDGTTELFLDVSPVTEAPDLESADLNQDGFPELILLDAAEISLFSPLR